MPLSIFNSNIFLAFRERVVWSLGLAVGLILLVAVVLPDELRSEALQRARQSRFFLRKLGWEEKFDLVVVGNSRVYRGVSPEGMASVLPEYRIANLGFSAAGLTRELYDHAEKALATNGIRPVVVLGVDPVCFTDYCAENGCLREAKAKASPFLSSAFQLALDEQLDSFLPMTVREGLRYMDGRRRAVVDVEHRWTNRFGWCASVCRNPKLLNMELKKRRQRREKADTPARGDLLVLLENYVRRWVEHGYLVVLFRPPVHPETRAFENAVTQFDEQALIHSMQQAGGVWWYMDPSSYHTYDSSHLDQNSAIRFSRDLALFVKGLLPRGKSLNDSNCVEKSVLGKKST